MPTPGWPAWMDFTPRGWLNPDFKPQFPDVGVIRACSRWCHRGVSGLKGFARIPLPPSTKARRVGRSTQTHLDAYHEPLGAERDCAGVGRDGGGIAAVARPRRPADHRAA